MDLNSLIARVKAILLTPKTEWAVIDNEPATVADLYKNYIVILAAIPAVFTFIKMTFLGMSMPFVGTVRVGIGSGLSSMIVSYVLTLGMVYVMALIVDALAPSFSAQKNSVQALKTVAYSYTAAWVAGVALILPLGLGTLIGLAGAIYSIYLLYIGLPYTMKCPPEKSAGYTAVSIIVAVVLGLVVGMVVSGVSGVGAAMSGAAHSSNESDDVTFEKGSPMDKLQSWSKNVEKASKDLEAAQKSGDQDAQSAALKTMMGAAMGGGDVESLPPDRLKPFIPESLAGMPRTEFSAERNNALGLQVSEARGTFSDESGRTVDLEITDLGSAKGLLSFASWAGVEGEKETQGGFEKTYRDGSRLIHEEWNGDNGEYTVIIADRFTVKVQGSAGSIGDLKDAMEDLDLSGLEDLKDVGVKK